ncbi:MAG: poly-gamma-glutamate synthase PgsB [Polyangiales bacterium]
MTQMTTELLVVFTVWCILVGYGIVERFRHDRALARIPVRIHVNGTRGKTSVARLIAAGLRAAGKHVCAKTSGSFAAIIDPEGREYTIHRVSRPNIIEQMRIVDKLSKSNPEVLVVECMALQPHFQSLTELRMIRSTHSVITNARPDHLDIMGPTSRDVAAALAGTTGVAAELFTAEQEHLDVFASAARDRNTALRAVTADEVERIDDSVLGRFRYTEHPENVALALRVCEALGVRRDTALEGMVTLEPEAGATRLSWVDFFGRDILFVQAFAANDPTSTEMIWEQLVAKHGEGRRKIAVVNCRIDRPDRSRQFAEAVASWSPADAYVVVGIGTLLFVRGAARHGVEVHRITMLEGAATDEIVEVLLDLGGDKALIVGMCNIYGTGYELARYFQNRSMRTDAL